uniref:Uncharacterized protein n=1 Tax=Syphacia muris TaxID=451379 RepID=A0A0N5A8X1_9BILA
MNVRRFNLEIPQLTKYISEQKRLWMSSDADFEASSRRRRGKLKSLNEDLAASDVKQRKELSTPSVADDGSTATYLNG